MKPTVERQAEKRGRMQGLRGLHHNTPGTWEKSGQQTTGGGSGHWPIGIVNHVRPGNADRCWCRALSGQSGLDPRVQTNGARVSSIQDAINASMVESSDYELGGLEQVA